MIEQLKNTPLRSRAWRLSNLYTILNAYGRLEPFRPNLAQRYFYNRRWWNNIILKARKLGFSTLLEIEHLDALLFNANHQAGIIDYTIEDAESKLAMLKTAYEHLDNGDLHPETWRFGKIIKRAITMPECAVRSIRFSNGSRARCGTSLRGWTPNRIHLSELGKTSIWAPKKAKEIVEGAFNSIVPGNVIDSESTHEGGKVGTHYNLLNAAMRIDEANLTQNDFRFHFFAWWRDPRYTLNENVRIREEIAIYFRKLSAELGVKFTQGQMLWYDRKQATQGHGMKKEFPSTPGEAFEAISEHAIYGKQMADLRAGGRICPFGAERNLPFFTFWDIGLSDYTSVWLIQPAGRFYLVLDWFEAEGKPGSAMPDQMLRWERKWDKPIARHFLPHDAETRSPGSGKSYVTELRDGGLKNISVVPRTPDKWLGIGYVRDILPHCWFQSTFCDTSRGRDGDPFNHDTNDEEYPSGVACLEGYQKDVSATGSSLRELPKHDLFSHSADAFRTFAEAQRRGMIEVGGSAATKPKAVGGPSKPKARS